MRRYVRVDFRDRDSVVDPPEENNGPRKGQGRWTPKGVKRKASSGIFLPDHEAMVRMIAMRGLSDDEIAENLGVEKQLFADWRRAYPSFNAAIESGRTHADSEVLHSLFKRATGRCPVPHTEIIKYKDDFQTLDMEKHFPPDTEACKVWMRMRQKEHWREERTPPGGAGKTSDGVRESKAELIAAIVGMIRPKSDTPTPKATK